MKPIPDFPDYFADEAGTIYSMKPNNYSCGKPATTPKKLKASIWNKYYAIELARPNGRPIKKKVAYLVLTTFVGPRPEGYVICHGIKGRLVDCLDNLSWGTQEENAQDKVRDGTHLKGEDTPSAKLNELQVRIIRRSIELSPKQLAMVFQVTDCQIRKIRNRLSWTHI